MVPSSNLIITFVFCSPFLFMLHLVRKLMSEIQPTRMAWWVLLYVREWEFFFYNSIVICSSAKCYSGICDNSFRWNIFRIRFHYNILHVFKPHWQETTQGHTKNSLLLHIRYNYNFTLLLTIFRFRMIRQVQFFCRFRLRHHFRLMRNPML